MPNDECFDADCLPRLCMKLSSRYVEFKNIINKYGIPPFFNRKPGFSTMVLIILEQQVSLASARAAYNMLKKEIGQVVPQKILQLTDEQLRSCYFSRQKIHYIKGLAAAITNKKLHLASLSTKTNAQVYDILIQQKGIGPWTIDIYLMMCLQRVNLFPLGDVALVNSMKHELNLPKETTKEQLDKISKEWEPYRTIAAFLFWHAYIQRKHIKYLP
jgi:DNA-3-methyladenine glycosylase II